MPVCFQLSQLVFQLSLEDVAGMIGIVLQDLVHGEEHRLVFPDDASVGAYLGFAVSEGVEGVDGLVRGNVGREMDDDLHLVGGHVIYLLDVDFLLVLGADDAVDYGLGGLSVGDFRNRDSGLVNLVDSGPYLHDAAALTLVVFGAVGNAAGGEVRENLEGLALQDCYGGVYKLVEVVRKNL